MSRLLRGYGLCGIPSFGTPLDLIIGRRGERRTAEQYRTTSTRAVISEDSNVKQNKTVSYERPKGMSGPSHGGSQATKLRAWRATLPSISDVSQALKTNAPTSNIIHWKSLADIARDQFIAEGLTGMSMREYLEQVSLADTFGRRHTYLRVSLTEKCNLRCLYCMPEEGVELTPRKHLLTAEELARLVQLFALAGVNKVRLTGGEPTLRPDLVDITRMVHNTPGIHDIGITTNGITLGRILPKLQEAGLSLINISLDTLQPQKFEEMTRRRGLDRVLSSIELALKLGYNPVKVNVVVMRGINEHEIPHFVELTKSKKINVRFIEYMPFDGNVWNYEKLYPFKDVKRAVEEYSGHLLVRSDDAPEEVAKNYTIPGYEGSISFVTSMTSAFCSGCNRIRLMADGNLKVCLFGNSEVSLRDAIREGATDDDLLAIISTAVKRKKAAHAGIFELSRMNNRAMVKIGG